MRALTRMRTLAAACALLLFVAGTAAAGWSDRQIDRPGQPETKPPMVGDPDQPTGGMVAVVGYWTFVIRIPASWIHTASRSPQPAVARFARPIRSRSHAR